MNSFQTLASALKLAGRQSIHAIRRWRLSYRVYRRFGIVLPQGATILYPDHVEIGRNFEMSTGCQLYCQDPDRGSVLRIGNDVKLNTGVLIVADCGGTVTIGNDVLIAPYVVIRAANHRFDDANVPIRLQGHNPGTIAVGDDVWLGAGVVLLPGSRVGNGSIVGAGSVVTDEIPPFSIAVGAPARVIGRRAPRTEP
jgi:acetyltransferase-like isoleucine patch superfamily enzyme